jgi:hypothetical protein
MSRRAVTVVACLTLAACSATGHESPVQPPPVNRVTSVTRTDSSILQFIGTKISVRDLFVVKDAAGALITDALIGCVTQDGFAQQGDSIVAPAVEARAKLFCMATTVPYDFSGPQLSAPAIGVILPGDSLTLTAAIDLRANPWEATFKCWQNGAPGFQTGNGVQIDSVGFDHLRSDSVVYRTRAGYVKQWDGGVAQMYLTGRAIRWLHPGTVDTITVGAHGPIMAQLPDTLLMPIDANGGTGFVRAPVDLVNGLRTYTGGSFCAGSLPLDAMTLEAVAP